MTWWEAFKDAAATMGPAIVLGVLFFAACLALLSIARWAG